MLSKICSTCGIVKDASEFGTDVHQIDGLRYQCNLCRKTQASRSYHKRRDVIIARIYGISVEKYNEMMARGCGACGSFDQLGVDHDHSCCSHKPLLSKPTCGNCTRGVLCQGCNMIEGWAKTPERLMQVAMYMLQNENVLEAV